MRKLVTGILCLAFICTMLPGAARCGAIEKIKSRGYLVAGVCDGIPPFGFVDGEYGRIVGFDVDICKHISDKLGVDLKLKPVTLSNRIPMLTQGSVDMLAAKMVHTFSRDETIDFSISYYWSSQKILTDKQAGIASAADLAGRKVGAVKDSISAQNIKASQPDCTVAGYKGYFEAFQSLEQGMVAAVTADSAVLFSLKNRAQDAGKWVLVGNSLSKDPCGLGLPENDSDFRDFINRVLADMWNSGEYQKIYRKWFKEGTNARLLLDCEMRIWPY